MNELYPRKNNPSQNFVMMQSIGHHHEVFVFLPRLFDMPSDQLRNYFWVQVCDECFITKNAVLIDFAVIEGSRFKLKCD